MSWAEFYLIVSGLLTLVILLVAFPWLKRANHAKKDSLSNTQIIRQRLAELDREAREGLISERDKRQASDELKLALVDESHFTHTKQGKATLPLIAGGVVAVVAAGVVYWHANQMQQVMRAEAAISSLGELSDKLRSGDMQNFTSEDVANLALAIRTRLRSAPEDDQGWMYLGRLQMALGQDAQALEAIQKAMALVPANRQYRITYAQALMATGDETRLQQAQQQLRQLLVANPANDNLALMMAVASAQLGDALNTRKYFDQVKDKLAADNDMRQRLQQRLAELEQRTAGAPSAPSQQPQTAQTGFELTISLAESLAASLPETGYLIVFAQDAESDNRMPAAVIKMPLQSFPVSVTLSEDNAMMPDYSLAQLSQAIVTARISADGDVAAAPGELQGQTVVDVETGKRNSLTLIIDKELM
ncbi:c-type cytochrome biogenesis protein CcmI [Alteromonas sp. ASW11-19]|uniref:C-type cytochrome biogenesis protein CcmI n=1 Tax=Alteromonas salexigens TaxID=2982530 RepID=A0ABT2VNM6_9ALTE|nr:c-type cytochrome biogenesis protein CcmI [Alteromonas salexigens]MCU7554892.1 c-type cytochrome biogenesis protein CcmI [Alteromonas salexigens]